MRDYHIKDPQVRQAEIIPVDEKRLFVDEYGKKIEEGAIRFGMKDAGGRIHYFCIRRLEQIPEYEADEIYPTDEFSKAEKERTAFCFRSFGYHKSDERLLMELVEKHCAVKGYDPGADVTDADALEKRWIKKEAAMRPRTDDDAVSG